MNTDFDEALSPEADKFLGEAMAEFAAKQEALRNDWGFGSFKQWGFDQYTGLFKLDFADGSQFIADGQVLGSYFAKRRSWEWAWNNPNVEPAMARDSRLVKELGSGLGILYLAAGILPIPNEQFASYLCAIGVKATDSIGIYRGNAGAVDVMITLKNPRLAPRAI